VPVTLPTAAANGPCLSDDEQGLDARRGLGASLLALAALLFLSHGLLMLNAPFGDSHDGRNAGVWASEARYLRDAGVVASRMGTRSPEVGIYANHPPLVSVETAVAETVGFGTRVATRAPAWLGSLISLALLWLLLRDAGLRAVAAGTAVVLVAATPMFLVFGTMLDTPVTSLPFGLGLLVVWERTRAGRPVLPSVAFGLALLAVLAGWQSLLLAGVVAGWAAIRHQRHPEARVCLAVAGGFVTGLTVLTGWLLWAFGGTLGPLLDQFRVRTGQTGAVSLSDLLGALGADIPMMFGRLAVLGGAGLVIALANRRLRGLAAVALAVTLPYALVFRSGAVNHIYWTFWLVLPIAVGLAAGIEAILGVPWIGIVHERKVAGAAACLAVALTTFAWLRPTGPERVIREQAGAGALAERTRLPEGQTTVWYSGDVGEPAAWLALATRRPAVGLSDDTLAQVASARPDDQVLVGRLACPRNGEPHRIYAFETAASVEAHPPIAGHCDPEVTIAARPPASG
jgi:hypothetical protein